MWRCKEPLEDPASPRGKAQHGVVMGVVVVVLFAQENSNFSYLKVSFVFLVSASSGALE
jgi:hypothetical protein